MSYMLITKFVSINLSKNVLIFLAAQNYIVLALGMPRWNVLIIYIRTKYFMKFSLDTVNLWVSLLKIPISINLWKKHMNFFLWYKLLLVLTSRQWRVKFVKINFRTKKLSFNLASTLLISYSLREKPWVLPLKKNGWIFSLPQKYASTSIEVIARKIFE